MIKGGIAAGYEDPAYSPPTQVKGSLWLSLIDSAFPESQTHDDIAAQSWIRRIRKR